MICELPAVLNIWPDNQIDAESIYSWQAVVGEFASWIETKLWRNTEQLSFS